MIGHGRLLRVERFAEEEHRRNPPPPSPPELAVRLDQIYKETNERIAAGDTDCEIVQRAMAINKILEMARCRRDAARQQH